MADISFLRPLDQPLNRRRLLADLKDSLESPLFDEFRTIVAFAKAGPLLRLRSVIQTQKARGLRIEAIIGVDQFGTSSQALTFAREHFDYVAYCREPNLTFHPKIYMFRGQDRARVYVGSNNLTVGGTETNFESGIRIDLTLPEELATLQPFLDAWDELLPAVCPATTVLTEAELNRLIQQGVVPDEKLMARRSAGPAAGPAPPAVPRSGLATVPPSALPAIKVNKAAIGAAPVAPAPQAAVAQPAAAQPAPQAGPQGAIPQPAAGPQAGAAPVPTANLYGVQGLAIQVKPHHNGEIFLSVTAALQNPAFFKWPFNGLTVPKMGSNNAYPQITPDPVVNIEVYGAAAAPLLTRRNYGLNTVYYARKSEIRITASPLVGTVPDYSIMIIQLSALPGVDYEIEIHTPQSPQYGGWLAFCNQAMPGGGQVPRRFGWF